MGGRWVRQAPRWLARGLATFGVLCLVWVCLLWERASSLQLAAKNELSALDVAAERLPSDPVFAGTLIGVLEIPRLSVSVAVLEGDDAKTLSLAVGHLPDTPLPWQDGNSALAGHRDTFFRPLKDLQVGDTMRLATSRGSFGYLVRRILIVNPEDVWVLDPDDPTVSLTLITCYPFYFVGSAPRRFIVYAERLPGPETSTAKAKPPERFRTG